MSVDVRDAPVTRAPAAHSAVAPSAPTPTSPTTPPASPSKAPSARRRPGLLNRWTVVPLAVLLVLGGAYVGYDRYTEGQFYVSTDNAQLTGTPIQVGSLNAGQVAAINVKVGTVVHKDDVLAQVALPSLVGTAQNGDPKLEFLGNSDTHVDVTAPSDGVVVAIPVAPGAIVAAGQPVVTLVDASHLWVNADVEETNVGRVQVGQPVIVHVDALNEDVPGLVDAVTPATAASFSILPASNTSGNFNKVTQLVPVRIAVSLGNQPALLGASAEVKIQVVE